MVVQDAEGRIVDCNPAAERILGLTADQMSGRTALDPRWRAIHEDGSLFPGDTHPATRTLASGAPIRNVLMGVHKPNGELTWILIDAEPVFEPNPDSDSNSARPIGVVASFTDVTFLRDHAESIGASEEHYRLLAEHGSSVVFKADAEGVFEWVSPSVTALLGWSPGELVGRTLPEFFLDDEDGFAMAAQAWTWDAPLAFEARVPTSTGDARWVAALVRPLLDDTGAAVSLVGGWRDIQGERDAAESAHQAEDWLRLSLQALQEPFFIFEAVRDQDGEIVDLRYAFLNAAAERMYQRTAADIVGHGLVEMFPSVVALGILDCYLEPLRSGDPASMRVPSFDENGVRGTFDVSANPYGDGVVVTARDVTAEVEARRALEESERLFRLLAENASDVVIRTARDGGISWVSASVRGVLGWLPSDLLGTMLTDLLLPEHETAAYREWLAVPAGLEAVRGLARVRSSSGEYRWMSATAHALSDDDGRVNGAVLGLRDVEDEVNARNALAESEARYRVLAENAGDFVFLNDTEDRITWVSASVQHVVGWLPTDLVGRRAAEFLHPADQGPLGAATRLAEGSESQTLRHLFRTKSGPYRWLQTTIRPVFDDTGTLVGSVGGVRDAQSEVQAEIDLHDSEVRYRLLAENASDVVFRSTVDGVLEWVSPSATELLGWSPEQMVGGQMDALIHPDDRAVFQPDPSTVDESTPTTIEARFRTATGSYRWLSVYARPLLDKNGDVTGRVGSARDITVEHEARDALTFQAFHDSLTGLRNRAWILDILAVDLEAAKRRATSVAVLFLDLDNFKVVNDSLGHAVGDEVLMTVAERISSELRASDRVGRLGGDEFIIIVADAAYPQEIELVAERVSAVIAAPMHIQARTLVSTSSIGIALSTPASTPETMLRDSDAALFRAKDAGRARWQFFDQEMHAAALARLTMETDLRQAVDRHEFLVHYQPIVTLPDGIIVGHEALLRWQHPERGLLLPGAFLHIAEASGLIVEMGRLMLDQVLTALAAHPDLVGRVSINVSAVELSQGDWINRFLTTLNERSIDPSRLNVEVTETAVLSLLDSTRSGLKTLRDLDVGIHVDDFGTGFSSISLLRDLPVTAVKLDQKFVHDLTTQDGPANALARGVAGLVTGLGLTGIAEGIETAEQAAVLHSQGWILGQGFYFGRPHTTLPVT